MFAAFAAYPCVGMVFVVIAGDIIVFSVDGLVIIIWIDYETICH